MLVIVSMLLIAGPLTVTDKLLNATTLQLGWSVSGEVEVTSYVLTYWQMEDKEDTLMELPLGHHVNQHTLTGLGNDVN